MENSIKEKINKFVSNFIIETGTPGIAVGLMEKGEPVFTAGFGVMSMDTNEPVTENTIFHMASVSKPFVATGIMQLAEQGKLQLDDPVVKYLPYFKIKGSSYETITIREMLSHISGIPDIYDYEWDKPQYDEEALERHVRNTAGLELIEGQRGKFRYSNLAFEVLGDLISKVSGMTFEDYMKKNILNPIVMKESTFLNREIRKSMLATPHCLDLSNGYGAKVSKVFPYNRRHAPSSTLCSNVVDMLKWAKVNLNKGTLDGAQILKEESCLEMLKLAAPVRRPGYINHMGLSWFLGEYKGNRVISHSGMDTGFQSNFLIIPDKEIGLVWMTNNDFAPMKMFTEGLLDIVLGYEVEEMKHSLAVVLVKAIYNDGLESADERYSYIKESCGDKYYTEENEFNRLAYGLCKENKIDEAIKILELGIKELPMADNLYDSLGEMHLKNSNKEMAIINYRMAVKLNPLNKRAIEVLKGLGAE